MKNMKLRDKLIVFGIVVGLIPMLIIGVINFKLASDGLNEEIAKSNQLVASMNQQKMEDYFLSRNSESKALVSNRLLQDGMETYVTSNGVDKSSFE